MTAIPFNAPAFVGEEARYLAEAIERQHYSGDGAFTKRCHALLEELHGAPRALLTTNCTHALELAALLLDLKAGDEVIIPSFTFVSTANAFALRGARIVFADIRSDTLNLDERALPDLVTERTRAVVPVHYAGIGCEMDAIVPLSRRHGFEIIEDNAHGLFGSYRGRKLGTFGGLSALSFHETKNVTCGEGGALVINDEALVARAEILREKGTNRSQFFRGQVDKYTWVDIGSSYLPSELLAAILLGQLESRDRIQQTRRHIFERYAAELQDWASATGARLPVTPVWCDSAYHMFYLLMPNLESRSALIASLRASGVTAVFHYQPLNASPEGERMGGRRGTCPVTEDVADRLVRLPFYNTLTDDDQSRVIAALIALKA